MESHFEAVVEEDDVARRRQNSVLDLNRS